MRSKARRPAHKKYKKGREALSVSADATNTIAALIVVIGLFIKFAPSATPASVVVPLPGGIMLDLGTFLIVLGIALVSVVLALSARLRRKA